MIKRITIGIFVIMIGLFAGFYIAALSENDPDIQKVTDVTKYLASSTKDVVLLNTNREEVLVLPRGTIVTMRKGEKEASDGIIRIFYNENEYYINNESLVEGLNEIALEDKMYVLTDAVIYKDMNSSILASVKKGAEINILEATKFKENTSDVELYKVKYEEEEGYIYAKYLTFNKEDSLKNFDENGLYQTHLKRIDTLGGGSAGNLDYYPREKANFPDNVMPSEARTLYINGSKIRSVDDYISFAKENNINAFVVDIKDNTVPAYKSEVSKEYSITNYERGISSFEDYSGYIKKIKDSGIYVIGRITVFKDSYFVNDNPSSAIIDTRTGEPFIHNGSKWPSAFDRNVWEFNVKLALEAVEKIGFNEIQFDYVRFPDRTIDLERKGYMDFQNTYNEEKAETIQEFLMYASDEIHKAGAYISVDVFGESANGYVTAYGQYWPAISNVVDVISGMPYPDHFSAHEYGIAEVVWTVPYKVLDLWGQRVKIRQSEIPTPAISRTWIQTYDSVRSPFVVYNDTKVSDQISALYKNGLTGGYMTWSSSSNLQKYIDVKAAFNKEYLNEEDNG